MAFPSSLPSYAGFVSTETLAVAQHGEQHNQEQADILGIATKMGTGAVTPTADTLLRGNGVGTSTWDQANLATDVKGLLSTSNGGTGTDSTTGSGSVVFNNSPSLDTPSLSNPTTTELSNTGGLATDNFTYTGTIDGPNGSIPTNYLSNPTKFLVYRNAALNSSTSVFVKTDFDTVMFDTGSNFDTVTNFRFTVTIAGFYNLAWLVAFNQAQSGNDGVSALYKNGSIFAWGNEVATGGGSGGSLPAVQASVNDYFEIFSSVSIAPALGVGVNPIKTYFSGSLESKV